MDRELFSRLVKQARIEWPELGTVTNEELEAFVRARVPANALDERTPVDDLLLVCACAKGVRDAEDAIHEAFNEDVDRAHARIRPPITLVAARHLVFRRLLAIPEGGAARIAIYRGDTDLASWMRNAINRTLLEAASQTKPPPDALEEAILRKESPNPIVPLDPELARVKANFMAGLKLTMMHSLSTLEPRERAQLRNAIIDGLDAPSLGLMYGLHPDDMRAELILAREKLEYRVRNGLVERMRISDKDHATLGRLVKMQLDASLAKALA